MNVCAKCDKKALQEQSKSYKVQGFFSHHFEHFLCVCEAELIAE